MGFRFQRSIKILPEVRLNFSKSGISTSLGGPGATVNLGRGRVRTTVGIPGTGMSYTEQSRIGGGTGAASTPGQPQPASTLAPQGSPPLPPASSAGSQRTVMMVAIIAFIAGALLVKMLL